MAKSRNNFTTIEVARGDRQADLVLRGGKIFSTSTREWIETDLAIASGVIVGWGRRAAKEVVDVSGCYLTPGFIDSHMHLESTKLWVDNFVATVLPHGTTAVAADPHEVANVLGVDGVEALIEASIPLPFTFGVCASSCVPASRFESSGAELSAHDIAGLLKHDQVLGVAEMMNYPGVIGGDDDVLAKIAVAGNKRVDGHSPGVSGLSLDAYLCAGIESDHECTTYEEALEKRRKGMWIFLREGSAAKNIAKLSRLVREFGTDHCALCTDDREPRLLLEKGHINDCIRVAVKNGITMEDAIVMATSNAAEYHGFSNLGTLSPGYQADVLVFRSLEGLKPYLVYQKGRLVAQDGKLLPDIVKVVPAPAGMRNTIHLKQKLSKNDLVLSPQPGDDSVVRVIEVHEGSIGTTERLLPYKELETHLINRLAVVERHKKTGRIGRAFALGFGLHAGAIASTVAHDAHNLMVVGGLSESDAKDMEVACNYLASRGGGQVVVYRSEILAFTPLPIAGLMSDGSASEVAKEMAQAQQAARTLGSLLEEPFMILSFIGLSVIPELRLTDQGLVDVRLFKLVEPVLHP